jgi:hypothetical protein
VENVVSGDIFFLSAFLLPNIARKGQPVFHKERRISAPQDISHPGDKLSRINWPNQGVIDDRFQQSHYLFDYCIFFELIGSFTQHFIYRNQVVFRFGSLDI